MVSEARDFLVFVAWILGPILGVIAFAYFWIFIISKGITKGINDSLLGIQAENNLGQIEGAQMIRLGKNRR